MKDPQELLAGNLSVNRFRVGGVHAPRNNRAGKRRTSETSIEQAIIGVEAFGWGNPLSNSSP